MKKSLTTLMCGGLLSAALAPAGFGQLSSYSQDFDGLDRNSTSALSDDGWLGFVNVFNPDGSYNRGYGVFAAPNDINLPNISILTDPAAGDPVGNQSISVFSDYQNRGDQDAGNGLEVNVFQEQNIAAVDVGDTYTFAFDAIPAFDGQGVQIVPDSAIAFIKTLDPSNGFATTNFITQDTSMLVAGTSFSLDINIDGGLVGQILQFGFANTTTMDGPSAVNYDNISFAVPEPASLALIGLGGLIMTIRRRQRAH